MGELSLQEKVHLKSYLLEMYIDPVRWYAVARHGLKYGTKAKLNAGSTSTEKEKQQEKQMTLLQTVENSIYAHTA